MDMQDFPAAHSMDTTWFAIDADGCVGIFETNEGGAVPKDLPDIENEINLVDCLLKDKPEIIKQVQPLKIESVIEDINIESIQDIKNTIRRYEELSRLHPESKNSWDNIENLVLILSKEQVIEDLKSQANLILRFTDEKIIVHIDKCDRKWLRRSIKSGAVLAAKETYLGHNLSWLGFYEYNGWEDSGSYYRNYLLKEPIYFNDLPPEIANNISFIKLPNIKFSETELIQPIEHLPCQTWGDSENWIDTNGVDHDRFPEYPNLVVQKTPEVITLSRVREERGESVGN
jgi:hypothetical protein